MNLISKFLNRYMGFWGFGVAKFLILTRWIACLTWDSCRMSVAAGKMPEGASDAFVFRDHSQEIGRLASWRLLKDPEKIEIGADLVACGDGEPCVLPGRSRPEIRAPARAPLTHELRQRPHFFPHERWCLPDLPGAQKEQSFRLLHSNRTQTERVEALEGFKAGRYEVMVATDIAARDRYRRSEPCGECPPSIRRIMSIGSAAPGRARERGRCVHHHDGGGVASRQRYRTVHRPVGAPSQARQFRLRLYGDLQRDLTGRSRTTKSASVRTHKGMRFGSKRRK